MLKKEEYEKTVRRTYSPLIVSIVLEGYAKPKNFQLLINKPISIKEMIHSNYYWYYCKKELEDHRKYTFIDWIKPGRLDDIKKLSKKAEKELIESTKKDLKTFGETLSRYCCWIISAWCPENQVIEEVRKALLKKVPIDEAEDIMDKLNTPLDDNFFKKEEYDLVMNKDIKAHVKEYEWIHSRYGKACPYTIEKAKEKLSKIDKKRFIDRWYKEKKELKKVISQAKAIVGKKRSILIDLLQFLIYYRTHRTDMINKAIYLYMPRLNEFAEKKGLSYEELNYCNFDESINKIPDKKVIHDRMKNCVSISEDGKIRILSGKEAAKVKEYLKEDIGFVKEFKGTIACRGKIKGKAKIIFSMDDFSKINYGDIIVTAMTTPEFVPIMKKAAAFVTDEGGVTCHAAIVSREMKKPCIIGTKIATNVLKDNDVIEVDAEKGIVRKLSK